METNTLKFTKTFFKNDNGQQLRYVITFSVNDDCHNGNEHFSVTGDVEHKAKNNRWYYSGGGQVWDEVYDKMTPELQNICDLHLCAWQGYSMYAIKNGFYYIKNGMKDALRRILFLTEKEVEEVLGCQNEKQLYIYIIDNKINLRWAEKAQQAIKTLEEHTGLTFKSHNDGNRDNDFEIFTPEEIAEERSTMNITPDYYSMENVHNRIHEMKNREADVQLERLSKVAAKRKIIGYIEGELSTRLSSLFMLQPELLDNVPVNDIEKIVGRITISVNGDYPAITFGSSFSGFRDDKKYTKDFKKIAKAFVEANKSWLSTNCVTVGYYGEDREVNNIYEFKEV